MKKLFRSVALFSTLALLFSTVQSSSAQSAADEKAVRARFDQMIELYKTGDVDKLASFYTEKATAIFYNGMVVEGKSAIREAIKQGFEYASPDDTMEMDGATVRFIDANNAVMVYRMHGSSLMPDGQKMDWKGVGTALYVKRGADWLIELNQDTPVMEMPGQ
jgi:uncharacterized protein (TIGR02246 family)